MQHNARKLRTQNMGSKHAIKDIMNAAGMTCDQLIKDGFASGSSVRNYWKAGVGSGLFPPKFDRHAPLSEDQEAFLRAQKQGSKPRKSSKNPKKEARKQEKKPVVLRVQEVVQDTQKDSAQDQKVRAGDWIKSRWFLVLSMLVLFCAQAIHTAGFVWHNTPVESNPFLRIALAVLCAVGIDLVALVMTAHGGGKFYLYIFAGVHFTFNILFHTQQYLIDAFVDLSLLEFMVKVLGAGMLSGALAFSLFSYTELFTKGFEK